ncbi:MAG: pyruvate formate lyase family protein [Anaerolineae bacterium]
MISPRIERLRAQFLLKGPITSREPELLWARSWLATAREPWNIIRRGQATAASLRGLTPEIGDDELLVGKFPSRLFTADEEVELTHWRKDSVRATSPVLGQKSHMAIDYETLLRQGLSGVRRQIGIYRERLDLNLASDLEKDAFYRACLIALDGLRDLSLHYADLADIMAEQAQADRAKELREIAAVCRKVPEMPATSFREALQAVHLVTFALCAGQQVLLFQLGRPDRYLLPLYRRDVQAGILTVDQAQELIDCLCMLLNVYTPRSLAVGFMVGGRDGSGQDICNELTRLFLESIRHTRLAYPGIGLCWDEDTPSDIKQLASELVAEGLTHPAIFNDDVITAGMAQAGLPPSDACLYIHSTCVEITPVASSNVYVASPYINMVQLLHDLLGIPPLGTFITSATGEIDHPADVTATLYDRYPTFEDLVRAYEARLSEWLRTAVMVENTGQMTRYYHGGYPLLSCFVNDCLARGRDIDQGGARHNWIMPSFVGLANLVDTLAVIRRFVYHEHRLGLEEVVAAIVSDYAGREDLRLMFSTQAPKYGNDDDSVDELAVRLTEVIRRECARYRTYLGDNFHPGFFCWVMHERLGSITAASADGRHAGQALGDGSGPAQGRESLGPTAAILSATKWNHAPMLGGIAVNLKFTRTGQQDTFASGLRSLIGTFIQRGGFEIQINVVDKDTLLAAQSHPEQYRDLVVRIGGYSDYFVGLSPRMQEEIILRTDHGSI